MNSGDGAETRRVAFDLQVAVMQLGRLLRSQLPDKLSESQLLTLVALDHASSPITLAELAQIRSMKSPAMSEVVNELRGLDYVRAERDADDGRALRLSLTSSARRLLANFRERRGIWLAEHLQDIDPQDLATLDQAAAIMTKIVRDV